MNRNEIETQRQALLAKRAELLAKQIQAEEIAIERVADATDQLVLAAQRDLAVDNLHRSAIVLRRVLEALQRIDAGTYGICAECEEPIAAKRLAALPWAALCLKCQEAADRKRAQQEDSEPDSWLPAA